MYNRKNQFNRRMPQKLHSGDVSRFIKKAILSETKQYIPSHSFADFQFCDQLQQNITNNGYQTPTPIQDQAITHVHEGRDVIGIAQTGTGKTAAFLLPLIQRAHLDRSQKILIIAPTRELALQIEREFRIFSRGLHLYSVLCIGGTSLNKQIYSLRRNPNFVIGTPGRIKDLEKQKALHLDTFTTVVLDEVDRMLDMGFIKDITYLLSKIKKERQSLFFSATVSPSIQNIMNTFLQNPVTISVTTQRPSDNVNQDIIKINGKSKIEVLHDLLNQDGFNKVLLFGRTKWGIEKLSKELSVRGFRVASIHGNKRQSQRERALEEFRRNTIQVLLATDIASRGIDIPDVTHVINYDMPQSHEDYIHRIGRTGRAEKFGTALTFID